MTRKIHRHVKRVVAWCLLLGLSSLSIVPVSAYAENPGWRFSKLDAPETAPGVEEIAGRLAVAVASRDRASIEAVHAELLRATRGAGRGVKAKGGKSRRNAGRADDEERGGGKTKVDMTRRDITRDEGGGGGGASPTAATPEIQELARGLEGELGEGGVLRIYNFVRNNIEYEPYHGLMKGATATLLERSGNDYDQACLMIALLRESGHTAQYVSGAMLIPTADVANWLRADNDDAVIWSLIASGGSDASGVFTDICRLDRVWVEVTVGTDTYECDPAFKAYERQEGVGLDGPNGLRVGMGYDQTDLLVSAGGTTDSNGGISGMTETGLRAKLAELSSNLENFIRTSHANDKVSDLLGRYSIVPVVVESFPAELNSIISTSEKWDDVPDSDLHTLCVQLGTLDHTLNTYEVACERLAVTYEPQTVPSSTGSWTPVSVFNPIVKDTSYPTFDPFLTGITLQSIGEPPVLQDIMGFPLNVHFTKRLDGGALKSTVSTICPEIIQTFELVNMRSYAQEFNCSIEGLDFKDFSVSPTSGSVPSYGGKATVTVSLKANRTPGSKSATIEIPNKFYTYQYGTLTAEIAAAVDVSDSEGLRFVTYENDAVVGNCLLKNSGSLNLTIHALRIAGGDSARFSAINLPQSLPGLIGPDSAIALQFSYDASDIGDHRTDYIVDMTYDGIDYELKIPISGSTKALPDVSGSQSAVFETLLGYEQVGTCVLKNNGGQDMSINTSMEIVGGDGQFLITDGGGTDPIKAGESRTIAVKYRGMQAGTHDAAIRVSLTYDGIAYTVDLLGLQGTTGHLAVEPKLWLGDAVVASGEWNDNDKLLIGIDHPYAAREGKWADNTEEYGVLRGNTYVILSSFGATPSGLPLERRQRQLMSYREAGLADRSREVVTETLNCMGQGWLRETALVMELLGNLADRRSITQHRIGVMAQETGYYIDVKDQFSSIFPQTATAVDMEAFLQSWVFIASAMEHGILEQTQGSAIEAVSTVKLLRTANKDDNKVYLVNNDNYQTVLSTSVPLITGYDEADIAKFATIVTANELEGWVLLPETKSLTVNDWTGHGYAEFQDLTDNAISVGMIIGGDLNMYGGEGTAAGDATRMVLENGAILGVTWAGHTKPEIGSDPVNLSSGAFLFEGTDLVVGNAGAPRGLNFTRHYSSSDRHRESALGFGWQHSYDVYIVEHTDYANSFGARAPLDAVQAIVASVVSLDLAGSEDTAQTVMTTALTSQWLMDELTENAVSVNRGSEILTYLRSASGGYIAPPGVTTELVNESDLYQLNERFDVTHKFNSDLQLITSTDADGNALTLAYENGRVKTVTDCYQRTLTLYYSEGNLVDVTDSTGRNISYDYDAVGNLQFVTYDNVPLLPKWEYVYDSGHRIERVLDAKGDLTIENDYDSFGRVEAQRNGAGTPGNDWTFLYAGSTTTEIDPQDGRKVSRFDENGRLISKELLAGYPQLTEYDGQGHKVSVTDAAGNETKFEYDNYHNRTKTINALNHETVYQYDDSYRLEFIIDALLNVTEFKYDPEHHLKKTIDALEHEVNMFYYDDGLLRRQVETDPISGTREALYEYDSYGQPSSLTQTDGGRTESVYTKRGDLDNTTDANLQKTSYTYDARRLLETVNDPNNHTISYEYDLNGFREKATDARLNTTHITPTTTGKPRRYDYANTSWAENHYDSRDWVEGVTDERGNYTEYKYDSAGRKTEVIDPLLHKTTFTHDANGRVKTVTDARYMETVLDYDALGRLWKTTDPLVHVAETEYNAVGDVAWTIDQKGYRTESKYDALRRMTHRIRADGTTEQFKYDAFGNMTNFVNAEGHVYTFTYDHMDRVLTRTTPAGRSQEYTYDSVGNILTRKDAKNVVTEYPEYDGANNLKKIKYADDSTVEFAYDANDNLKTIIEDSVGTTEYFYDEMNRITSVKDRHGITIGYKYDLKGNRTEVKYPDSKTVVYRYDNADRLDTITDWVARETSYGYDDANNLRTITYPNEVIGDYTWDDASRLTGVKHTKSGVDFVNRGYTLDEIGNVTEEEIVAGLVPGAPAPLVKRLRQDKDDRLTTVSEKLVPDAATWSDSTVVYDNNGNMESDGSGTTLLYDYENRVTSISTLYLNKAYEYDGAGDRTRRTIDGTAYIDVLDRGAALHNVLMVTDSAGDALKYYIWGIGILAQIDASDGATHYYHTDRQGNTLALTDGSGNVTDEYTYSPYGEVVGQRGTTENPYRFVGGHGIWWEGGSVYHMKARCYNATLGRFFSADPMGLAGGQNLFQYANSNPFRFIDPLGQCAELAEAYLQTSIGTQRRSVQLVAKFVGADDTWQYLEDTRTVIGMVASDHGKNKYIKQWEWSPEGMISGGLGVILETRAFIAAKRAGMTPYQAGAYAKQVAYVYIEIGRQNMAAEHFEKMMKRREKAGSWSHMKSVSELIEEASSASTEASAVWLKRLWHDISRDPSKITGPLEPEVQE